MEDQDAFDGRIPPSPQEYPILGLNLLRLLVQNGIAEFYTKHAVELEQSFMEGAYNHVLSARQTVRHETYVYFMDLLAETVRNIPSGRLRVGLYISRRRRNLHL
ncbi:putative 26S proteasome non-ATPase regulatory subunit 8 homolog B isoform X1 [Eucalyptus grandis]|uniref:putative 26S proteasome non-ATPase regulatory subunit 8 homolog B isoform X1 n=1 Tax=Eucalyptus grandis TaxID=71139 RepID=UPI00192EF695|nr:putative 26S proteasome non-ATPase regulatory subunit 8 homolog B isoform X1 [Eucalyptus grandis]XP_039173181.1 putative 26S proteasome non-ATPase regulatory subunit 8 homolog B isoform X1 [Eucalyptus grandis]